MRFYEPDEGVIAYDGTKIGEINTAALRGGISYVTQETFLFHDTVAENLKVQKRMPQRRSWSGGAGGVHP